MNYINTMNRGWYIRLASAVAVFLLFLLASTNVSAQSAVACTTATNVANFGADADLFANTPNPDGDDWFSSPTFPGIGQGIIGLTSATAPRQISAAQFNTLITTVAAAKNSSYEQRMAAPYQTVVITPTGANILLDAVAARDHWTAATADSSAFLGSNKNGASPLSWQIGISNVSGKTDLIDVGGHVRRFTTSPLSPGELWGYAYATRNVVNGNSYVDFEVYRTAPVFNALTGQVTNSGPAATGGHTAGQFDNSGALSAPGDLLVMIDYTNGGNVPTASVRVWVNPKTMISGRTFATYQDAITFYNALPLSVKLFDFTGIGASDVATNTNGYGYFEIRPKSGSGCLVYARTNNTSTTGTPWGSIQAGAYQANIAALQLVEVAINFSAFGLDIVPASGPCFNLLGSLLVKTRSSASYSATLEDYAGPYVFGAFAEVNAEAGGAKEITCTNPTVTLSGASTTPNANYSWTTSNGNIVSGGSTLSPVVDQPGTYYLRVTNPVLGSCDAVDSVVVTLNNQPATVSCTPGPAITCANGSSNLTAVATASGSNTITSYSWSNGGSAASTTVSDGSSYTVTVTQSNGCTTTSSCNVIVNTCAPTAAATNAGDITCANTSITVSANAIPCSGESLSYLWSNGASTPTIDVTAGGAYSVTITQTGNGCTTTTSSTVNVNNANPTVTCSPVNNITCSNPSQSLCVNATASGSNTISNYSWTKFGSTTNCITVSDGDPYTVTVTQSNGCTATATCNAVVDTCRPQITATNNGPLTCTNTSRTVSSSLIACLGETVNYAWSNGETSSSFSTSTGGNYIVTVSNVGNGCSASASTNLGVDNSIPTVFCAPTQAITCSATSSELTATATPSSGNSAVSYLWSPGGATTQNITVNNGDSYTVTFTQSNGCTATSSCSAVVDTCRPSVTANNGGPITCTTPTPSVSAIGTACGSATLAYLWNNGQTGDNFTTAAAGTYSVTVTQSSNGCTASASTILESNNTNPTVTCSANTNITCSTTSVDLNSSANASGTNTITGYSWSNGATTSLIAVSDGNPYTVTVTQSNGCTASSSCEAFVDTCSPSVIATNAGPITCTSPSVAVSANGTACNGESLSYSWSNGNTGASFNTSTAAAYTVTVTHNGNGCTASDATTVATNNSTPSVNCTPGADITCTNTSTTLTAVAVAAGANSITSYAWSPGAGNTPTITVNNGATYTITVTQSNGCTASNTCAAVVDNCNPTVTVADPADITCLNTSSAMTAVANACNGDALVYLWNTGSSAGSISESTAGTYTVTVTQSNNGCTATASVDLVVDNCLPTATASNSGNVDCNNASSTISVAGTPCTGETVTYLWNNGETGSSFTTTTAGTYSVTVTHAGNGCSATDQTTITADVSTPTVTCVANGDITCNTSMVDLDATASASTGNSITSYSWAPGGATSASIPVNDGTSYTVTVTQSNGCTATSNCAATVNTTTPSCSIAGPVSATCNSGGNNVSATVTDADAGATYSWSIVSGTGYTITSGNTATLTFTAGSGTAVFQLTVTNGNGCSSTCNVTVNAVCGDRYCTYTQGAYGNAGGMHCNGLTTPAFVTQLIGANPIVIGGNGNQISFDATDVTCLISRLPGGGISAPLNGIASCLAPAGIAIRNGKFANTLLNQTITLSLNLRINGGALATLPITGIYLTTQASTGAACGTTGTGIPGTDMVYNIPQSVVNYLTASGNNTVGDLLFLANSALARTYVPTSGTPSLSAIASAVDAINRAFDECRIFAGFSNMLASTVRSTVSFDETAADAQLEANGIVAKAFPNPFHYTTTIEFTMKNYCSTVSVEIFSLNGEKVATLYQGEVNGGQVKRLDFNADKLADGIYVYRIATNDNVYYDKLILNK